MPTEYAKKTKKGIGKRQVKGIKTFLKKKNKKKQTRNKNMIASDKIIFLKKERKRSVSMNVNAPKLFLTIKE